MRVHPQNQVPPVLVTEEEASRLLSVNNETIDRLIRQGDLPVKRVGVERLIPYRSLLIFAGVARWKYQEIVEA
jgi:excisionase family DNA binding protein